MKSKIFKDFIKTPLGIIRILASDEGVCQVASASKIQKSVPNIHTSQAKLELEEYFMGNRKKFSVKLVLKGTDFQLKVWDALMQIPYGELRSYKHVAQSIKNSNACRAVGNANNKNPIMIIIPCHRVISHAGGLGGYALGIKCKMKLLELENSAIKYKQ